MVLNEAMNWEWMEFMAFGRRMAAIERLLHCFDDLATGMCGLIRGV
jgi:hypothetical protein